METSASFTQSTTVERCRCTAWRSTDTHLGQNVERHISHVVVPVGQEPERADLWLQPHAGNCAELMQESFQESSCLEQRI